MKRVLVVLEAGLRLPSGLVRGLIYRGLFAKHDISATFVSRQPVKLLGWFDSLPGSLRRLPGVSSAKTWLTNRLARRNECKILRLAGDVDVVYLTKVNSYEFVRTLCRGKRARIVFDFVDSVWLQEWRPNEFNEVLQSVDAVTTDNEVNAAYVRNFNRNCVVIPDPPQVEKFDEKRDQLRKATDGRIELGWIGSPGTAHNLYVIWEALEELAQRHPHLHVRLVGTGHNLDLIPPFENVRFSFRPFYNQAEMIEEVLGMDIGLFPLQNVERCRGRGVLKATIYMSGQAVVVSSPVGQCCDLIQDGVNGMLAGSTQEWVDKLERLITDAELRRRLAAKGLETVRQGFRIDQSFAKLKKVLMSWS